MKARVFHNDLVKKNGKDFEVGQKKTNKLGVFKWKLDIA